MIFKTQGKDLDHSIALQMLNNASVGLGIFVSQTQELHWCNAVFQELTGLETAQEKASLHLLDIFSTADHSAVSNFVRNAQLSLGKEQRFQCEVRKKNGEFFSAELKIYAFPEKADFLCFEMIDMSRAKLYDSLQIAHRDLNEQMASLVATQAEMKHAVRIDTISELGSDIAHLLLNPITMCLDILRTVILPNLTTEASIDEMRKALNYMQEISNLAVWFRKFSNPSFSHAQAIPVSTLLEDVLRLNTHRFSTHGVVTNVQREQHYDPCIFVNPIDVILWFNTAFAELVSEELGGLTLIEISCRGDDKRVIFSVGSHVDPKVTKEFTTTALEKFSSRISENTKFSFASKDDFIEFSLSIDCYHQNNTDDFSLKQRVLPSRINDSGAATAQHIPLILVVDDEKDIRRLISRSLKQSGLASIEAEDGRVALDFYEQEEKKEIGRQIQVIVCDVRMPRMTGTHFLSALRKKNIAVPFVFFSSNIVEKKQGEMEYENVFYLTKDQGIEKLKEVIFDIIK